ncbi:Uncharacterised protein [Shigella sonnei]|nr:Uncharacterised protein [Shigella sonnei]
MVSLYGIVTLILQCVSADFIQQTNVTTFLTVIQQNTTAFLGNLRQCRFELEATIAAQAEQGVTGQTFGMDARKYRGMPGNIAID